MLSDFVPIGDFLPNDVIKNSGLTSPLFGELKEDSNEIIVIEQLGRSVGSSYVCHISLVMMRIYKRRANIYLICQILIK